MRGMLIIWGIVLSVVGVGLGLGSKNQAMRAFFSHDPILLLAKKKTLNKEEKETLTEAVFATLQSPSLESGAATTRQRILEANEALAHLYSLASTPERTLLADQISKYYGSQSGDQDWMQRLSVLEILEKNHDSQVIDHLFDQVINERNPNLFLGDKGPQRELLLDLARRDQRVMDQVLVSIANEFQASSRELAQQERLGYPCNVSRTGSLLIEVLNGADSKVLSEQKKALVSQLLTLVPDQPFFLGESTPDSKPVARTTRLDVMRAMSRFGFDSLDELEMLASVLMDDKAGSQTKTIASQLILALMNHSPTDTSSASRRLAQQHQICSQQPAFSYLDLLAQRPVKPAAAPADAVAADEDALGVRKVFEDSHRFACDQEE